MTIRFPAAAPLLVAALGIGACADLERRHTADYATVTHTEYVPGPAPAPREITRYADENRDGKVTREEAKADPALARVFDQYDRDKSGALDRAEFAQLEQAAQPDTGSYRTVTRRVPALAPAGSSDDRSLNRTGIDEIRPAGD